MKALDRIFALKTYSVKYVKDADVAREVRAGNGFKLINQGMPHL